MLLQFLDFMLNGKTRSGILVDLCLYLCTHRQEVTEFSAAVVVMAPPNRAVDRIIL